ncbi:MAG: hypothetical protein HRT64_07675, partial [Erythrobacter sp.]|nr:hypothetical protein [Erythrobacter sp.]
MLHRFSRARAAALTTALVALALTGCATMDETTEADSDNAEPASGTTDQVQMPLPATGGPATGETWRLVAIYTPADSSNVEVPDELQAKHTIRFEQGRAFL